MEPLLDFYLSEMTVSDRHGGGITLQRILGDDLERIGSYIHLASSVTEFQPIPSLAPKSSFFEKTFFERDTVRSVIGCRPSHFLYNRTRPIRAASWADTIARQFDGRGELTGLVCPQGTEAVATLEKLKRHHTVKYVTWLMDDHATAWRANRWRYPAGFRNIFAKHLREASTVFAISPVLAEHYRSEFGVKCDVLFGPGDPNGPPEYTPPSTDGVLKIGYFGRIWKWQLDALAVIARALDPSRERLHIYGNDTSLPSELQLPAVELKGRLPMDRVIQTMRAYDAVVVPASFFEHERNLTELNIATKMSECLASGTLTVVCGPPYAAMVRYLQDTGAALCLTDPSPAAWPAIADAIRHPENRRRMLDAAASLVQRELSTEVMRGRWHAAVDRIHDHRVGT